MSTHVEGRDVRVISHLCGRCLVLFLELMIQRFFRSNEILKNDLIIYERMNEVL